MIKPKSLKIITSLFLLVILSAPAFSLKTLDDATDFLQMEQKTEDAVVRKDIEYLKTVYADDFRFAHGSGNIQNKAQWLESVAKGAFTSRKISENEVELHGDIAITAARLDVTRGEDKYWLKYIRVYRRAGDRWQMISHRTTQETHLPRAD